MAKDKNAPVYAAQTFEKKHTKDKASAEAWFAARRKEAGKKGATMARRNAVNMQMAERVRRKGKMVTIYYGFHWSQMDESVEGAGLLIECWPERPKKMPEPGWMITEGEADGGKANAKA